MMTNQDHLEAYKKAVRLKYEQEKNGDYSSFLLTPSRGRLRDLCKELFKNHSNVDDLKSFRLFFGFDCNPEGLNELRTQKDKFRPIETFFKGETDLTDIEGINIAAFLVDFQPRPFMKYLRQHSIAPTPAATPTNSAVDKAPLAEDSSMIGFLAVKPTYGEVDPPKETKERGGFFFWIWRNKFVTILLIIAALLGGFSLSRYVFTEKQCMQWQNDRFVVVDCLKDPDSTFVQAILPLNERLLDFRRVEVSDTTIFFRNGKSLYWYCKVDGKPQFFNSVGDGSHPETGGSLRRVTPYIVERHVE